MTHEKPPVAEAIGWNGRNFRAAPQQIRALDRREAILLLRDIISIFEKLNADRLRTSILIDILFAIDDRPWTGTSSEYLCDAQRLARLLRPHHIRPRTIRFEDGTAKGYLRWWFLEAITRVVESPVLDDGRRL